MDLSTADGGGGPVAVELTSLAKVTVDPSTEPALATVAAMDLSAADGGSMGLSTADSGRDFGATELTNLAI